jgi:hypothetical protein
MPGLFMGPTVDLFGFPAQVNTVTAEKLHTYTASYIQWNRDLSFLKGTEKMNDECGKTINPNTWCFQVLRSPNLFKRNYSPQEAENAVISQRNHPVDVHIFHNAHATIACLTQLLVDFDEFHATQVEESDNDALFFEC